MSLVGPILDDRTYAELREELVRRIPVYTPEWTDFNENDPGIVLLELFAFLGETLLYRFNQIPEATKVAFLRLLDVALEPASAARVLVAGVSEAPEGAALPAGSEVRAGEVVFETREGVVVWPLEAVGVGKKRAGEAADEFERARREEVLRTAGEGKAAFYEPVAVPGEGTLDVGDTLDKALWVALLAGETADVGALRGRAVSLGVVLDEGIEPRFTAGAGVGEEYRSGNEAPGVVWEFWRGGEDPFRAAEVLRDTTKGLGQSGVVELTFPADLRQETGGTGRFDPPRLPDSGQEERVVAWLRVRRAEDRSGRPPRIRWVGANAVEAVHERTAGQVELLGVGNGEGGQVFRLSHGDVREGSVSLEVEETGVWVEWTEASDFHRSRQEDRHFTVDRAAGLVRFGPGGRRGRVPQIGERIRVTGYRWGGGAVGNVPAGAVVSLGEVEASNPFPAAGGKDAETIEAALGRIPAEVHRRDRAVTAEDFSELALRLPGVARADVLPLFHPDTPHVRSAGVVSVVVFPAYDARNPNAPAPDRALLRRVAEHLDARRLITTELHVIPPEYRRIAVAVGVAVRKGHQVDAVRRWVELILRQFLAPLPPYGPDGRGWPLGRAIRRAELEAVAVQVEGVEYLEGVLLAESDGDRRTCRELIDLRPWQVPELAEITVVGGPPLEPGAAYGPAAPGADEDAVHLPLPREVC